MDEQYLNKLVWQGILVVIAYYIVGAFVDYIVWGIVGLGALRIYQEYRKHK